MPFGHFEPQPVYVPTPPQPRYVSQPIPPPPRRVTPPVERPREPEVVRVSLPGPDELGINLRETWELPPPQELGIDPK